MQQRLTAVIGSILIAALSACSNGFVPFTGISSGSHKSYAAPVSALNYIHENLIGGGINGGCIGNTNGLDIKDVGKSINDGSGTCGAAYLAARWQPGMTARIYWNMNPYPDWHSKIIPGGGLVHDPQEMAIIDRYDEHNSAEIPLPPPDGYGDNFGQASGVIVHFLACNQIFITYGYNNEAGLPNFFDLLRESQKLCRPRPVIRSMADYHKHKAEMDAIHEERKHIPQVILPRYMKQLEAEGRLPSQQGSNSSKTR